MSEIDKLAGIPYLRASRRTVLRGMALGGAGLAAAALVGCGDDDDDDDDGAATPTETAMATETPTEEAMSGEHPSFLEPAVRLDGQRGGTLRVGQSRSASSLDPFKTADHTTKGLAAQVYGAVLAPVGAAWENAPSTAVQPNLAESWEQAPDGLTITLNIRPDAMITAPIDRPMDAQDVLYSFNHHQGKDGMEPAPEKAQFAAVTDFTAADSNTIVMTLSQPVGRMLNRLADIFTFAVLPRETGPDGTIDPEQQMVGWGPWMLESFDPESETRLVRNPNWWQAKVLGLDIPWMDSQSQAVIPQAATRLVQFKGGNLDVLTNQSPADARDVAASSDANVFPFKSGGWGFLAFGEPRDGSAPWSDDRVRKAISLGLDRDLTQEAYYEISDMEAAGFDIGPLLKWHGPLPSQFAGSRDPKTNPTLGKWINYDLAEAKKLLDAAGHADGFTAPYHHAGLVYGAQWNLEGEIIQQQLADLGITLQGGAEDYASAYVSKTFVGDFDGIAWILKAYPDLVDYFPHFQPGSRDNVSKVDDPDLLAKLDEIAAILDVDERIAETEAIQDVLVEKMYYVPGVAWQLYWVLEAGNLVNGRDLFQYARGGQGTFQEPYSFYDPPQA